MSGEVFEAATRHATVAELQLPEFLQPREVFERPLVPNTTGRFGIKWRSRVEGESGILVTSVQPGTAAARAGLRAGDRILTFAELTIDGDREFQRAVSRQAGRTSSTRPSRRCGTASC